MSVVQILSIIKTEWFTTNIRSDIIKLVNNFRSSLKVQQIDKALEAAENNLWNGRFVLDKNNQPKYPDIQTVPKEIHSE